MWKQTKICLLVFINFSILTGLIYPAVITGIAQLVFPDQANGSLIIKNGTVIGSRLLGQQFEDPKYFWGRLSATVPAYNASASSASNFGPSNPKLKNSVRARMKKFKEFDPNNRLPFPVDLVTASGSGLDPHISIAGAHYQMSRIARIRGLSEDHVEELIQRCTTYRFLGFLGEPAVNVLQLNLALDGLK